MVDNQIPMNVRMMFTTRLVLCSYHSGVMEFTSYAMLLFAGLLDFHFHIVRMMFTTRFVLCSYQHCNESVFIEFTSHSGPLYSGLLFFQLKYCWHHLHNCVCNININIVNININIINISSLNAAGTILTIVFATSISILSISISILLIFPA